LKSTTTVARRAAAIVAELADTLAVAELVALAVRVAGGAGPVRRAGSGRSDRQRRRRGFGYFLAVSPQFGMRTYLASRLSE
jgi:hypothetical protein